MGRVTCLLFLIWERSLTTRYSVLLGRVSTCIVCADLFALVFMDLSAIGGV